MRKIVSISVGVALAAAVFAAVPASAEPAVVLRDQGPCGIPGANADGDMIFGGAGQLTHQVQNDNHVVMTCKGEGIINDSGRTQQFPDFPCGVVVDGVGMVVADQSHATVTKKGQASVTCKVDLGE